MDKTTYALLNKKIKEVENKGVSDERLNSAINNSPKFNELNEQYEEINTKVISVEERIQAIEENGVGGGNANIDDTTISKISTWSSSKIEDFVHTNDGTIWSDIQGKNLSVEFTKEGYLREVEIWGNTVQNPENLNDIRHLGEEVDGKYKIEVESKTEDGSKTYKTTILSPYQLRKVNDVSDRLYWDSVNNKYVIEKNIIDVTFNSNSGWGVWYHSTPILRFMKTLSDIPVSSTSLKVISNKVPSVGYNSNQKNIYINNGKLFLILNETDLASADLAGLNTWFANEPLTVYYQLATPQLIETNITEKIIQPTYIDKTVINVTGGIDGIIKAKAPLDGGQAIQTLSAKNVALNEEVITLSLENEELKQMDNELVATSWDMDFRICEVEWALEDLGIGQEVATLSLENNIKSMKGSVSNMALTRFEQAKIMIVGGVYNKETLTRQLTTYLNRGYLTQEEYDELVALMEARDLVVEV